MRFHLSEELDMTRTMVREFAEKEVGLSAGLRDEEGRFDRSIFHKLAELGLAGIPWSEKYGGGGGDYLTFAVVVEELSRVCASTGAVAAAHICCSGWPIYRYGSEEQKQRFLIPLAAGDKLGACAFLPTSSPEASAEASADVGGTKGEFVLNGSAPFVQNAGEAETYVVFARQRTTGRRGGGCAFIVERGTPGLSFGPQARKLGLRSLMTREVRFAGCRIPAEQLIGKAGQGTRIAEAMLAFKQLAIAAQATGIAQGAMELAAAYAKERNQFGKPIGQHQAILFKLADMATQIEAARLLAYQAAWRMNEGSDARKEAAAAGRFAAAAAASVTLEAVQVFGGYGYMREFKVERYMRDAKCLEAEFYTGWSGGQRKTISDLPAD